MANMKKRYARINALKQLVEDNCHAWHKGICEETGERCPFTSERTAQVPEVDCEFIPPDYTLDELADYAEDCYGDREED